MKTLIRSASLAAIVAAVLLLHGGGHTSDPFAVAVANAATRCPDGFTVKVHGLPAGSDPTSSLSASCVLDLGIPAGAAGAPGATGAPGPAGTAGRNGVSGYALETVTAKSAVKAGGAGAGSYRLAATAMCKPGKKAIGGGARMAGQVLDFTITASEPTPNGQGWTARMGVNPRTGEKVQIPAATIPAATLTVTAICAVVS
jgi:hypothetical protein